MKKAKTTTRATLKSSRTWDKEDYYEFMDVFHDAHAAEKHASVRQYAEARRKAEVSEADSHAHGHTSSFISDVFHSIHVHQPTHKTRSVAVSKAR